MLSLAKAWVLQIFVRQVSPCPAFLPFAISLRTLPAIALAKAGPHSALTFPPRRLNKPRQPGIAVIDSVLPARLEAKPPGLAASRARGPRAGRQALRYLRAGRFS